MRQCRFVLQQRQPIISIHAPQWGATAIGAMTFAFPPYFNPRTPVGCDRFAPPIGYDGEAFQSTHPSGVRPALPRCSATWTAFQSTHPSGVRPKRRMLQLYSRNFNPRTPVGCDAASLMVRAGANVFQSTHPSGVRPPPARFRRYPRNFNPRTPVGCDSRSRPGCRASDQFQSTHPSGVRPPDKWLLLKTLEISIHAPQWGATLILYAAGSLRDYFNPRTPVGCDCLRRPLSSGRS